MEFRILGPLEVHSEAGAVVLGGIKPRAVLAVLLLHANEPVSAERLALALWGEEAPRGAVKTVQVHISRLRKALGDAGSLETTPAGYRLRVSPEELDAQRFESLLSDGKWALAAGRADRAADLFTDALSLWRGPPLAELEFESFAQPEIARLEERRLSALELRAEAELAAGRVADTVAELQRLVVDHPTRERLAGLLMLALYRCGRQTEALAAYQVARQRLIADAGLEPGPELRELQEAILRQDTALLSAAAGSELPPELDALTKPALAGRDGELGRLREHWRRASSGSGALVGVTGAKGIGKTRLAAELAGEAHRDGASVLYVHGDSDGTARLALGRAHDATRPTLVVVDEPKQTDEDLLTELAGLAPALVTRPVLVLVCGEDAGLVTRLRPAEALKLPSLGTAAARAITIAKAPGHVGDDVPVEWLLQASGGVPARLHDLVRMWAKRETARHVGAVATRTVTTRTQLRSAEAELADGVEELQVDRDRIRLDDDGKGPVICPFKGLASFDVADAPYFFGRERLVAALVARLVGAPLLGIVGPSGSGKSSVLRAGLLPALSAGVLPGSAEWEHVLIRPGEHPLRELRSVPTSGPVLLAVDQFEEVFTACHDESERTEFIVELARFADRERSVVVLAVRADQYGRCAGYPELSAILAVNHVLVGAMRRDELARAVECPALVAGLRVEPELVDALVSDVAGEPGALPLLSTSLLELWQRRDGRRLRHADYERSGGMRGAVARLAEEAFGRLDAAQQTLARSVLLRLVGESSGGAVERRRVPLPQFDIERDEEVRGVLKRLADGRILTVSAGTVELAHEALLREWPRLRRWLDDDREGQRLQRRLTAAAQEWDGSGRDEDALYRGARLAEALEWQERRAGPLNEVERAFLAAGAARRQRERTTRRRWIRLAFGVLTAALAAISVVAGVAVHQRREAEHQRDLGQSRDLAFKATTMLQADPGLSLALARRAVATAPTAQAATALRQAVLGFRTVAVVQASKVGVFAADLDRRGERVATAAGDGQVRVWNLDDGRAVMTARAHHGAAFGARLSPDGHSIASAGEDGVVDLTEVATGQRRELIRQAGASAQTLTFAPTGMSVAAGFTDGTVRIADVGGQARARTLKGHRGYVYGLAFSDDGQQLASAGEDGTVRLWDLAGGRAPLTLPAARNGMATVSFSPDGARLIGAGAGGWIHFWDARTGLVEGKVRGDDQTIWAARFSPDGQRIVYAGEDGAVRILDAASRRVLSSLRGHRGTVFDAAFSANGARVISTGDDGTVRLWDPEATRVFAGPVSSAVFSPDGARIMAGGKDGTIRIWSATNGRLETMLRGHTDEAWARFSPDGSHVVSTSYDGTVRVWSSSGGAAQHVFRDNGADAYAADLDRQGRRVVSGGSNGRVIMRNLSGGPRLVLTGHRGAVLDVSFSPTGQHVLSASKDGTIRIWGTQRAAGALIVLRGHRRRVNSARFSRDGRSVVSAGVDGTVQVWRLSDRRQVVLRGHEGDVGSAAFNPTGDRVVSSGLDGTVRLWDARGGDSLVTLQHHRQRAWSSSFSQDGSKVLSGGDDGLIRLSECEVCGSLSDVLATADSRVRHQLTAAERQRFLGTR